MRAKIHVRIRSVSNTKIYLIKRNQFVKTGQQQFRMW